MQRSVTTSAKKAMVKPKNIQVLLSLNPTPPWYVALPLLSSISGMRIFHNATLCAKRWGCIMYSVDKVVAVIVRYSRLTGGVGLQMDPMGEFAAGVGFLKHLGEV